MTQRGFMPRSKPSMDHNPLDPPPCSVQTAQPCSQIKSRFLRDRPTTSTGVLNRPATMNDEAIARLPQLATNLELDASPSIEEVSKTIKQMTRQWESSRS